MQGEELKGHRKKLEIAINQTLTESPQVNDAIQAIRDVGYDVFLIIEATIGFNRKDESSSTPKPPTVLKTRRRWHIRRTAASSKDGCGTSRDRFLE